MFRGGKGEGQLIAVVEWEDRKDEVGNAYQPYNGFESYHFLYKNYKDIFYDYFKSIIEPEATQVWLN